MAADAVRSAFEEYDRNGDGTMSKDELTVVLRSVGRFSREQVDTILRKVDTNSSGNIQYEEFLAWLSPGLDTIRSEADVARCVLRFARCDCHSAAKKRTPHVEVRPPPLLLEGLYERQPPENEWHYGELRTIFAEGGAVALQWTNRAQVRWKMATEVAGGPQGEGSWAASCGAECPYGAVDVAFTAVEGGAHFDFLGERYSRVGDLPRAGRSAVEGLYERRPPDNDWHFGELRVIAGAGGTVALRWLNRAGASWRMAADVEASALGKASWTGRCGEECPYDAKDVDFVVEGDARFFVFGGEKYWRVGDLPQSATPCAEALLAGLGQQGVLSPLALTALEAYLEVARHYQEGAHQEAARVLCTLWSEVPPGDERWWAARAVSAGPNFGEPACYYVLRMLEEILGFMASEDRDSRREALPYHFRVVALRRARGCMPPSFADWESGRPEDWPEVERLLHPLYEGRSEGLPEDDGMSAAKVCHTVWAENVPAAVRTSLYWWGEYLHAVTRGRLRMHVTYHVLDPPPEAGLPRFELFRSEGRQFTRIVDEARVLSVLPPETLASADAVLFFAPSAVPDHESFKRPELREKLEWVTGGAGATPDGHAPMFVADDLWAVRVPYHMGSGPYSQWDRQVYLPQWLQHEFNHHLFLWPQLYEEHGLETGGGHSWFDRSSWPADFEGTFEADYYAEAMRKRFLAPGSHPPLWYRIKLGSWPERGARVEESAVMGDWLRDPPENDWHYVTITRVRPAEYLWTNRAGVSWALIPGGAGLFTSGSDCPYGALTYVLDAGKPELLGLGSDAELAQEAEAEAPQKLVLRCSGGDVLTRRASGERGAW